VAFRRLSVFAGGWTISAAEAVTGPDAGPAVDALDVLASLAEKSLVHPTGTSEGEPRFAMLETLREFAGRRLNESDEVDRVRQKHAEFYARLAEELEPHLTSPARMPWLRRLEADRPNLREALQWSLEQDEASVGLRILGCARALYWLSFREGRRWVEPMLALPSAQRSTLERARALVMAGQVAYAEGDLETMHAWSEEAAALSREWANDEYLTLAMCNLLLSALHEPDRSQETYEEARRAAERQGDPWLLAFLEMCYGAHMAQQGESEIARTHAATAIQQFEQLGDAWMMGMSGNALGLSELQLGDFESAERHLRASLPAHLELGDRHSAIVALTGVAMSARFRGKNSLPAYREALVLCRDSGDAGNVALCLEGIAANALAAGEPDRAACMLGAAAAAQESGVVPALPGFEDLYAATRAGLEQRCGEQEFLAAFEQGHALSIDAAIELALDA
jgi:tetratricopeptide (TPR) repeat protein